MELAVLLQIVTAVVAAFATAMALVALDSIGTEGGLIMLDGNDPQAAFERMGLHAIE